MTDTFDRADRLEAGVQELRVPEPRADRESLLLKVGRGDRPDRRRLHRSSGWWGASGTPTWPSRSRT